MPGVLEEFPRRDLGRRSRATETSINELLFDFSIGCFWCTGEIHEDEEEETGVDEEEEGESWLSCNWADGGGEIGPKVSEEIFFEVVDEEAESLSEIVVGIIVSIILDVVEEDVDDNEEDEDWGITVETEGLLRLVKEERGFGEESDERLLSRGGGWGWGGGEEGKELDDEGLLSLFLCVFEVIRTIFNRT